MDLNKCAILDQDQKIEENASFYYLFHRRYVQNALDLF